MGHYAQETRSLQEVIREDFSAQNGVAVSFFFTDVLTGVRMLFLSPVY
jgi:hypothetical protein